MIIDKDKNKIISKDILLSTYRDLLNNSGLQEKQKKLERIIEELIVGFYRKYVFSNDFLQLFDKSKRIAKTMRTVEVDFKVLGLSDTAYGYYPNKVLTLESGEPIGAVISIGKWVNLENIYLENVPSCNNNNLHRLSNILDKITPEEIDVLKNVYIDLFKVVYAMKNFKGGSDKYLPERIKTYGQLHDYDMNIFEIAYSKFVQQREELKAKNYEIAVSRLDKDDVPGSLQRLKRILDL